jgi:hypothetical protein
MSYIDNITRATKAYRILSQATNVHLDLAEQINRLAETQTWKPLFAAYKALTGETFRLGVSSHLMAGKTVKQFIRILEIDGDSREEKIDLLNEFGSDIHQSDIEEYRHECETFGLNYDSPCL